MCLYWEMCLFDMVNLPVGIGATVYAFSTLPGCYRSVCSRSCPESRFFNARRTTKTGILLSQHPRHLINALHIKTLIKLVYCIYTEKLCSRQFNNVSIREGVKDVSARKAAR
jgi:hypothetical protein